MLRSISAAIFFLGLPLSTLAAQDIPEGSSQAGRSLGQKAEPSRSTGSGDVEVAQPSDLSFIPSQELEDDLIDASGARLVDALAIEDSFVAPGLFVAGFEMRPTVNIGTVFSDNADGGEDRESRLAGFAAAGVVASTDWDRHQIGFQTRGSILRSLDGLFAESTARATIGGRYDIGAATAVGATLGYDYVSAGLAAEVTPSGAAQPGVENLALDLRASHRERNWGVVGSVGGRRVAFAAGSRDRRSDVFQARLRALVRATEGVTPFMEARATRIDLVSDTDPGQVRGAGWGYGARGGVLLDLGPEIVAELAAGLRRDALAQATNAIDDDRTVVTFDGTLVYAPAKRHRLRIGAASDLRASGLADAFARSTQSWLLAYESKPFDTLRIGAGVGLADVDYRGIRRTDRTTSTFALVDYDFGRFVGLSLRYDYEDTRSDTIGVQQIENRATLLLRLRR